MQQQATFAQLSAPQGEELFVTARPHHYVTCSLVNGHSLPKSGTLHPHLNSAQPTISAVTIPGLILPSRAAAPPGLTDLM